MSGLSPTRSRMIDAAIEMIEVGGEASVRVALVASALGVSEPAVYHHFENRAELVTAAYIVWYERNLLMNPSPEAVMRMVQSREDFERSFRMTLEWSFAPERVRARSIRVAVLGAAQTNSELRSAINDINVKFLTTVADNIRTGQSNGWVKLDVDPTALAFWLHGQLTGRFFAEMTDGHVDLDAWNAISIQAVLASIRPD